MNENDLMNNIKSKKIEENENYVFNECQDWLTKYIETYNKFERIRLSSQEQDLRIKTGITKTKNIANESRYAFFLDLSYSSGALVLEGPSISISEKNRKTIDYLLVAITEDYLRKNKSTYNEITEDMQLQLTSRQNKDMLVVTGIEEWSYDWNLFTTTVLSFRQHNAKQGNTTIFYNLAQEEKIEQDNAFITAIDYSDRCFQRVLRYANVQKKR